MAGLYGLKILLLCTGLIELAICSTRTIPPPGTVAIINKPTSIPITPLNSQTASISTTPPPINDQDKSIISSTSPTQSTKNANDSTGSQTKPTPPKCTYTVTPVIYGFRIDLKASTSDTYNISYQDESGQHMTVEHQTVNNTIVVSLKPCRKYTFTTIQPECELQGNSTLRTEKMDDLEFSTNTKPGYLCYVTKWDISDAEWNSPVITWDKDNCFELLDEHFCTNFTTNVAVPGDCSVNISKTIPITAEYSTVKHSPNLEFKNVLPVEIVWKNKPKNCSPKDLDIHYTCEGNNGSINLDDLEPFQKYNCSGKFTHNSKVINTKSIDIEIKCKVDITQTSTNTSISLKWTNDSINCPNNTQLFHSCVSCRIETKVKDCYTTDELHYDFNKLQPFTKYICSIEPRYKDMSYDTLKKVSKTIQTAPGVPDEVVKTSLTYTQNNAFTITCEELKPVQWKGKEKWYIATITGSETKEQKHKKCNFTFADLGYSTDYTVQIFTYNGKYKSKPIEKHITTRYNDKAVTVFLIILTSLALLFFLYKIYNLQRKTSNTTSETKTTVMFISGTVPLPRGFRGVKTDAWYTLR
ncbi:receptor-type tyrosine-protein phosphatase C isoform X3 [Oncorhynchus tshawytscha]|uniref:receptor-type tyrosine-protein phosphatase C isoform X3 n=1 Tax=Oncorhynchus tshawytscha TaxID=74940 RepID=UPI001C3E80BF|nr:receptor-type tyrosine-protein phosphatase C isoform X3 [Oncorhynchus tshawytscha]